jgi:hypothetical protein
MHCNDGHMNQRSIVLTFVSSLYGDDLCLMCCEELEAIAELTELPQASHKRLNLQTRGGVLSSGIGSQHECMRPITTHAAGTTLAHTLTILSRLPLNQAMRC